jgi:hypothetical protein
MPQETNLNITPYFDDFLADSGAKKNNYYKVLFKPGYPVQARELTTIQSILQNQIEQFGNHIFKEGSVVIPGQINYNDNFTAVEVESEYLGIPLSQYAEDLIGREIVGATSGIRAKISFVLGTEVSPRGYYTLYINYISSGQNNASVFENGEVLNLVDNFVKGALVIQANQGFALTASENSTSTGSSIAVSEGVYFLRGTFVEVDDQLLVLDPYTNRPSYFVGFDIEEEIVTPDDDSNLNDNAQGFTNFAAPGADRLKIRAVLAKKNIDEQLNESFVKLLEIRDGVIVSGARRTQYSVIGDELARRTYDESGDYYVKAFTVSIRESLDDRLGNNGAFKPGRVTYQNNVPSDDLAIYQISPGKAYVRGYEVETVGDVMVDIPKPRETQRLENQSINYLTGPTYRLNNSYGSPQIGLSTSYTISLRDSRVGNSPVTASGKEIGLARVYDFGLESGSYETILPTTNEWDLSLYDIQPYTEIYLNSSQTLSVPTQIVGKSSGAVGYLRHAVTSSGIITAYNIQGTFVSGEQLIYNGEESTGIATGVAVYTLANVQSIFGSGSSGYSTFSADTKLAVSKSVGSVTITAAHSGTLSTVRSTEFSFPTNVKVGDIVSYTNSSIISITPTYSKVTQVNRNSLSITSLSTVAGICSGDLPITDINPSDFKILSSQLLSSQDNTLYTKLPQKFVESVETSQSNLIIRKQFDVSISDGLMSPIIAEIGETFQPFDEERYVLTLLDGRLETLTEDRFVISNGGRQLEIVGLSTGTNSGKLIATLRKVNIKNKVKQKKKVNSIIIDKSTLRQSGVGGTTLNDGLIYGNFPYGSRVQDRDICLLVPDATKFYGVFESSGLGNPIVTRLTLTALDGPSSQTDDLIIGEEFLTENGECVGIYINRVDSNNIEIIKLNDNPIILNEPISFSESRIRGVISDILIGDRDISTNFDFIQGQEDSIYNYSKIVRKPDSKAPTKKIRLVFESAFYTDSDDGDITTISSYDQFNYRDIPLADFETSCSDIIDIRPRVSDYSVSQGSRSAFEFLGRSFNQKSNSAKNVLASDESFIVTYSYYLPRIDRIYLTKDGEFRVVRGESADTPSIPLPVNEALEVAQISLPPYLLNTDKAQIKLAEHKRYRMSDIALLEDRIFNLEYYTTLSILETKTESLFVPDENGLNRFKSGFFVDNFTDVRPQILTETPKNSVDVSVQELRPSHYTTQIDLLIGSQSLIGIGSTDVVTDTRFLEDIIGSNIKKTGQLVTLDYTDSSYLEQPFATRAIPVTPFLIVSYNGTIELNPSSDIWIDTQRQRTQTVNIDLFTPINNVLQWTLPGFNPANGLGPITWGSWNTTWTGSQSSSRRVNVARGGVNQVTTTTTTTRQQRTGTRLDLNSTTSRQDLGDRVVSSTVINFMRSRNVEFVGKRFRPFTQMFAYFDSIEVDGYCFPKLVQIEMVSGVFRPGEVLVGTVGNVAEIPNNVRAPRPQARFRICKSNHKYGRITRPSDVYTTNPYTRTEDIPENYSATSNILNIDTFSMSQKATDSLYGLIIPGMRLRGLRSGAEAIVTGAELVTDSVGTLIGSFFIPNPNETASPKFETGIKVFKLTSSPTNSTTDIISSAQEQYFAQGTLNQVQKTVVSTRSPRFDVVTTRQNRTLTNTRTSTRVIRPPTPPPPRRGDPLAQSFRVDESGGVFVTKIDLYFRDKDSNIPLVVQLRTMQNGVPTTDIYPFSEVVIDSANINVSAAATVPTTVTFPSPVYLKGDTEHAIVLMSDSPEYFAWCSRLGEIDITTQGGPESRQIVVTEQPTLGSLFKSQNGSTWDPSQFEDLKFTLYSAQFNADNLGTINFFNPNLGIGNDQIRNLLPDSFEFISKTVRVGIATSILDPVFEIGNTIVQGETTGKYVGVAGSSAGTLSITNAGIGYTPNDGSSYTFTNVVLTSLTGRGRNATADITIGTDSGVNGVAIGATIASGGSGYTIGDVLTATRIGNQTLGRNVRFTVGELGYRNELLIDQVQGDFITGTASTIRYINSSGITTDLNGIVGGGITVVSVVQDTDISDGYHIKVNHKNHGMHSETNDVAISGVLPDSNPVRLIVNYESTSSADIALSDATIFGTFEGIGIGTTTKGYIQIDNEIISYEGVIGNTLTGITRAIDGTIPISHQQNTLVYKYENNNVSLRRINKTHSLQDVQVRDAIGLDHYHIKLDVEGRDIGTDNELIDRSTSQSFPKLYIRETKSSGGSQIYATQNIPYEMVQPQVEVLTLPGTEVSAAVRTVSGASISNRSDVSFVDRGFEAVTLNEDNYLPSPRIVCSKTNEDNKLGTLPGNKSFELSITLGSDNSNISPVIDLDRVGAIFTTNRVNNVITGFSTDSRVNTIQNDPSAFTYALTPIELELPATSIRLILSAYINDDADLRALYAIGNNPSQTNVYNLFPGYDNLDASGLIIDPSRNSGLPNKRVQKDNEYISDSTRLVLREYEFFIDKLTPFRFYSIKLIGTSTNQAYPPRVRDLRVIAFA